MYKNKLLFTMTTIPICLFTLSTMEYHKRRYNEKTNEIALRRKRLSETPVKLLDLVNTTINSSTLNSRQFNENYAYKMIEIIGKFNYDQEIQVDSYKHGEKGYQLYTPLYYENQDNKLEAVFVDRGWVDEKQAKNPKNNNQVGYIAVRGCLTQGTPNTKYSKTNDLAGNNWHNVNLEEMTFYRGLPGPYSTRFVIKQVWPEKSPSVFPMSDTVSTLTEFNVSPESHNNWRKMYTIMSFAGVFGNMFYWVCL